MVELHLRDDAGGTWHTPRHVVRPGDPPFVVAANIVAGWLYEVAGPFFWAALTVLLALGEMAPR
jgi:hypothetical protein